MLLLITTILSMLALGWVVWITLQRQEAGDDAFQDKLRKDDERAQEGRRAMQGPRKPPAETTARHED
jgi:hypothetical protein